VAAPPASTVSALLAYPSLPAMPATGPRCPTYGNSQANRPPARSPPASRTRRAASLGPSSPHAIAAVRVQLKAPL